LVLTCGPWALQYNWKWVLPDVSFFESTKFENNSSQSTYNVEFSQKISSFKLVLKSKNVIGMFILFDVEKKRKGIAMPCHC
jgi:hypothetical protein